MPPLNQIAAPGISDMPDAPDAPGALDMPCYLNGAYLPLSQARISPLDRGFLYADGAYELIRSFRAGRSGSPRIWIACNIRSTVSACPIRMSERHGQQSSGG